MGAPDIKAAIERVERSRQTHVEWLAYWRGVMADGHDPATCEECLVTLRVSGDAARQERLVAEYDNVLAVLRSIG